jgi:hypothetical protein
MNPPTSAAPGSPLWQLVFVSFAVILILFELLRGWRRGVARQLARLGALIAAYFAAFFCGKLLVSLVRPFVSMPDMALSVLAGIVLAVVVYGVINACGTLFFRRTDQHDSLSVRLLCGAGGAVLGIFFGTFFVWLIVVAIRSIGSVVEANVRAGSSAAVAMERPQAIHAVDERRKMFGEPNEQAAPLAPTLTRLKNSLELGAIGEVVKKADLVPPIVYQTLGKLGRVASNPQSAERFLSFPGAHDLSEHPKVIALRDDPAISQMLAEGRYLDLLQNEKLIEAANDPDLQARFKNFDLNAALNYALEQKQTTNGHEQKE